MPNFPSIYLELQELWKRTKKSSTDITDLETRIGLIKADISDGVAPSGRAGGVLGYPNSTYPNPNGLAAIDGILPISGSHTDYAGFDGTTMSAVSLVLTTPTKHLSIRTADVSDDYPGMIRIQGGSSVIENGGFVTLAGGYSRDNQGGGVYVAGGHSQSNLGGDVTIQAGEGIDGGQVVLLGGNAIEGNGGHIVIEPGSGSTTGDVFIATNNSTTIKIGKIETEDTSQLILDANIYANAVSPTTESQEVLVLSGSSNEIKKQSVTSLVEQVLQNNDLKYTMLANFTSSDGDLPSVQANITGGTPPYTYEWSLAQGNYNTKVILPPFNSSSVVLINNFENNSYIVTDSTMLKLTVTDSNNVKNTFYHNHSVVGYSPMTLNVGRVVTASYCGDGNMLSASIPLFGVDFLDSTYMNDIYETQTKCSDTTKQENYSIQYRELRDATTFNIMEKFTIDHYNHNYTASVLDTTYQFKKPELQDPVTYNITEFNENLNLQFQNATTYANNTVLKSYQQIRKINQLYGLEIHKYSISWNAKVLRLSKDWAISGSVNYPDLTGTIKDHVEESIGIVDLGTSSALPTEGRPGDLIQVDSIKYAWSGTDGEWNSSLATRISELELRSIKDCIGDIKVKFIPITDLAERPETGSPGDVYEYDTYYAWNPIDSSWDTYLGDTISDIYTTCRAKRDASGKALHEFILSTMPFVNAAFNFPLHKIR